MLGGDPSSAGARMSSLFGGGASKKGGDTKALAYTAPREPGKKPAREEAPKAAAGAPAVQYAYAGQCTLYKLERGAFAAASAEPKLGCVVLGSGASYQVLVYDSKKQHICAAAVGEVAAYALQPHDYVNFSARGATWSAHFDGPDAVKEFCRAVALCHMRCLAMSPAPPPEAGLRFELARGGDQAANEGDAVGVTYARWASREDDASPQPAALAKEPPAEAVRDADKPLRLRASAACETEPVRGLGLALVGATLHSTVGVALSPQAAGVDGLWTWVECDVVKIRTPKKEPAAAPAPEPAAAESPSLAARMAGLAAKGGGGALPMPAASPPATPEKPREPEPESRALVSVDDGARSGLLPAAPAPAPPADAAAAQMASLQLMQQTMQQQQTQQQLLAIASSLAVANDKLDRLGAGGAARAPANLPADPDLEQKIVHVIREHGQLRAAALAGDGRREGLEEKIAELREKNAALVGDKVAVMEKLSEHLSRGSADVSRVRELEAATSKLDADLDEARRGAAEARVAAELAVAQAERAAADALRAAAEAADARERELRDEVAACTSRLRDATDLAEANDLKRAAEADAAAELRAALAARDAETATGDDLEAARREAAFLETRAVEAEKRADDLGRRLGDAAAEADQASRDHAAALADARAAAAAAAPPPPSGDVDPAAKKALVKALMSDVYGELYAAFVAPGADESYAAGDIDATLRATLKGLTAKHLAG